MCDVCFQKAVRFPLPPHHTLLSVNLGNGNHNHMIQSATYHQAANSMNKNGVNVRLYTIYIYIIRHIMTYIYLYIMCIVCVCK